MLMMDDPLSLLMQGIWLLAAGMYPLGFLFGSCSACCGCPWMLNFDRCMVLNYLNRSPLEGTTQRQSLRRFGGTGEVQYMGPGTGTLQIHNVQSQIQIPVRISISASGASRTPVGDTRTQVWRFIRATPTSPLIYDVLGPAWHLEVELSVTGVATQAESGVSTAVGVDSEGQPKLFVAVNQWTSTITHDESVTLSPVGLQRWGPGISGTQSFRLTQSTANATRVSGENYSGWSVSKLSGITISGRRLAVRVGGRVVLKDEDAVDFLNGDREIIGEVSGQTTEFSILPSNVFCDVASGLSNVGVSIGLYPESLTLTLSSSFLESLGPNRLCGDNTLSVYQQNGPCSIHTITSIRGLDLSPFIASTNPAAFFCGGTILWNLINGPCRESVNLGAGTLTLNESGFGETEGIQTCSDEETGISLGLCVDRETAASVTIDGETSEYTAVFSFASATQDGRMQLVYVAQSVFTFSGYIDDPCSASGSVSLELANPTDNLTGTAEAVSYRLGDFTPPPRPVFEDIGPCFMSGLTVDGFTSSGTLTLAALAGGQCVYGRLTFSNNHQCEVINHSVACQNCIPEVTIISGEEYSRVTYIASGDKEGLIEIVAKSTWLGGQGVTFVVVCGQDSIEHTVRRGFTAPTAPRSLTVTRGPCSEALLQWQVPEWDGGQPITAYTVQFRRISVTAWTTFGSIAPPSLSAIVDGLVRVGYEFRVSATNSVGTSAFSNVAVDGFALAAPTGLTVVRTPPCTSAQLSWTPPAQAECVVVAAYEIQLRVVGTSEWTAEIAPGDATTGTLLGLTAGTRYEFRVGSVDEADVVRATPLITSGQLPLIPTNVTPSLGTNSGEVDLTWSHSMREVCFPTTDFNVQVRPSTTTTWSDVSRPASTDTFTTVTGLTQGVSYFFRVRAVNSVGNSSYSTQSSSILIPLPE
jgi:hypothetical protein